MALLAEFRVVRVQVAELPLVCEPSAPQVAKLTESDIKGIRGVV
jgi:hypothetical protein